MKMKVRCFSIAMHKSKSLPWWKRRKKEREINVNLTYEEWLLFSVEQSLKVSGDPYASDHGDKALQIFSQAQKSSILIEDVLLCFLCLVSFIFQKKKKKGNSQMTKLTSLMNKERFLAQAAMQENPRLCCTFILMTLIVQLWPAFFSRFFFPFRQD